MNKERVLIDPATVLPTKLYAVQVERSIIGIAYVTALSPLHARCLAAELTGVSKVIKVIEEEERATMDKVVWPSGISGGRLAE